MLKNAPQGIILHWQRLDKDDLICLFPSLCLVGSSKLKYVRGREGTHQEKVKTRNNKCELTQYFTDVKSLSMEHNCMCWRGRQIPFSEKATNACRNFAYILQILLLVLNLLIYKLPKGEELGQGSVQSLYS